MSNREKKPGASGFRRLLNYIILLVAILVSVLFVMESRKDAASAPAQGPAAKMPPQEAPLVRVQKVVEKNASLTREYIGRVEAIDRVDMVARVSGYLESIDFSEGRPVNAGDLMFTIEQDQFRAEIESRRGSMAQIEANLAEAEKLLRRLESAKRESVPETEIEAAQRDVAYYRAQLVSAKANLDLAEIDLAYTTVRAPMAGRVTKKNYSVGDYVGPNSGTIASIVQFNPIRVVCSISEVEYLDLIKRSGASPEKIFRPGLRLQDGSLYPGKGRWDFAATEIDSSTGTLALRSRYSNPDGLLIPGGYVTVVLSPVREQILPLVPQSSVAEDRDGSYVYIVGKDNVAEKRTIQKGAASGTDWIVEEGVRAGETVVVEGMQKVRPGQTVQIDNSRETASGAESLSRTAP